VTTPATGNPECATVELDGSWAIGDKIHGGYLLAQVVRAALSGGDYPHPLGVSAHFASAPDPGPADVEIERLRSGRRVGFLRARLRQRDVVRAEVLISAGTLPTEEPRYVDPVAAAPTLPPPEECAQALAEVPGGGRIGHASHLDMRLDPATAGWMKGKPSGHGVVRGWIRRADGGPIDPYWLLIAGDAPPPVTFDLGIRGWVPTVTLDAHIRSLPAPGWLIAEQGARLISGGWLDETCHLWDERGRLVASVRQLAGYREN
jgi:acyl-CoA thioesterase